MRFTLITAAAALAACVAPVPSAVTDAAWPEAARDAPALAPESFALASSDVLAGRLARFLWNKEPDVALVSLLRAEPLSPKRVSDVAEQMLTDQRSHEGIRAFFRWWLLLELLDQLEKVDPDRVLDSALRRSMLEEAPALGAHLTLETRGTYADLLTAPFTFVDERLARHYGIEGIAGSETRRVPYPPDQNRIGLLTGAGLLTLFSSLSSPSWPAKRSWMITDQILCTVPIRTFLPPPPLDPSRSIREQMLTSTAGVTCMGCHKLLNSPGFALIGFDSFGRWRPEAGHGPGETEGWIPRDIMADEPRFEGPEQLAHLLASRDEAPRCLTRHWLQFAVDRETPVTGPALASMQRSLAEAYDTFAKGRFELRALVLAIVRTRAFAGER